jgi:hypothetical protein
MAKVEYNYGRRIYSVKIRRADQPDIDDVRISADSRKEAETFCREMFGDRLIRIVNSPPYLRQRRPADTNKHG